MNESNEACTKKDIIKAAELLKAMHDNQE